MYFYDVLTKTSLSIIKVLNFLSFQTQLYHYWIHVLKKNNNTKNLKVIVIFIHCLVLFLGFIMYINDLKIICDLL